MTRNEINNLEMLRTVEQFLADHYGEFSNIPVIVSNYELLRTNNVRIESLIQGQSINLKANMAVKTNIKDLLIERSISVINALKAHAVATNDIQLKTQANITASELKRDRENDLVVKTKQIYEMAQPLAEQLLVWGISSEAIEEINEYQAQLTQSRPYIRNISVKKSQATSDLGQCIKDTKNLLVKTLDPLMQPFKNSNSSLYGEYKNARKTIDRVATHTKGTNTEEVKE